MGERLRCNGLMRSKHVRVTVNLSQIRANAAAVAKATSVDLIAVVKSDAYGLGVPEVVDTIGDLVAGWCVFSPEEARIVSECDGRSKPILVLGPSADADPEELATARIRPAVWTVEEAKRLQPAKPILSVDTGMHRFACPPDRLDAVIAAGAIDEAFTHATGIDHAKRLIELVGHKGLRLHAAATALLDKPDVRLNAVRPGLALYRSAARISTRLLDIHTGDGPAGYTGFTVPRFGLILCGYSNGLRRGICMINGTRRNILELGMQSAYVEIGPEDREGDEVLLLGEGLNEADVAQSWSGTQHSVLVALTGAGNRTYSRP
jgi:alanine racemase